MILVSGIVVCLIRGLSSQNELIEELASKVHLDHRGRPNTGYPSSTPCFATGRTSHRLTWDSVVPPE